MTKKDIKTTKDRILKKILIGIYQYPNSLKSAIYGIDDTLKIANKVCTDQGIDIQFEPIIFDNTISFKKKLSILILPPSCDGDYYLHPQKDILNWIQALHAQGTTIASVCAGSFILAATRLIQDRTVTTHWNLSDTFQKAFPEITLNTNEILIDNGDVITAGGMFSWLDLSLELVAKYASMNVMRELGKTLVVDTARRYQRFYQQFNPTMLHGDQSVVMVQQWMNMRYKKTLTVHALAKYANFTERTLQRRFLKATGYSPNQYLQRLRVQKACDLLENSKDSFDSIANQVGYHDTSACRKVFIKTIGLTPREFRARFVRE